MGRKSNLEKLSQRVRIASRFARRELEEDLQKIDKKAKGVAQKGTELYRRYEMDDRLNGTTLGAKTGLIVGMKGGLLGMKFGAVAGAVTGFVLGPKAAKKFAAWRDSGQDNNPPKKEKDPANEPSQDMK